MLGRSTSLSHAGRKRRRNEDNFVCRPPLFAIADGMGGATAGQLASGLAADVLKEHPGDSLAAREELLVKLVQDANERVYRRAAEDESVSGMGTTMTAAVVDGASDTVVFGHVGDSRAYLVRAGSLEQLTQDHSLVGELVRSGKISPEEAEVHPQRSVITRALGTEADVDVDTFSVQARPGDLFLLCSDGLSSMVGDETIRNVLVRSGRDLELAAKDLVTAANRGGGDDNITVVLFEIAAKGEKVDDATRPMAAVGAAVEEPDDEGDDEDTLSGLDGPEPVGTMVVSVGDLEAAARAQADGDEPEAAGEELERGRAGRVLATLALVVFLGALVLLALWGGDLL